MAKKSKRRRVNPLEFLKSPKSLKSLLACGAGVLAAGAGLFTWHAFAPQETRDKIESVTLDVIDVVRESNVAPDALVFWLDLVADNIPLARGVSAGAGLNLDASAHVLGGAPAASRQFTFLKNTGYIVGYDEARKNPAWVAYRVFPARYPSNKRPDGFEADERTRARVESKAYSHSGYDRGHMAPNHAIAVCYGIDAQRETFLMSNVVPQKHGLNAGFWMAMEQRIIKRYAPRFGDAWVICGPIYDKTKPPQKLRAGINVPSAFFLIVSKKSDEGIGTQAFIVPHQEIKERADPGKYLASIREIEEKAELNFFPNLPAEIQDALEQPRSKRAW